MRLQLFQTLASVEQCEYQYRGSAKATDFAPTRPCWLRPSSYYGSLGGAGCGFRLSRSLLEQDLHLPQQGIPSTNLQPHRNQSR